MTFIYFFTSYVPWPDHIPWPCNQDTLELRVIISWANFLSSALQFILNNRKGKQATTKDSTKFFLSLSDPFLNSPGFSPLALVAHRPMKNCWREQLTAWIHQTLSRTVTVCVWDGIKPHRPAVPHTSTPAQWNGNWKLVLSLVGSAEPTLLRVSLRLTRWRRSCVEDEEAVKGEPSLEGSSLSVSHAGAPVEKETSFHVWLQWVEDSAVETRPWWKQLLMSM